MIRSRIILLAAFLLLISSCDILRQIGEMQALSKCEFRIHSLTDIYLAGINVSKIQDISDVRPMDIMLLTSALLNNQLPLSFDLNLEVKNPNEQVASLNRLEWMLFIDDMQMLEGAISERFVTQAGETAMLPVRIGLNLAEILQGEQADKIIDFGLGLAEGSGKTTRVMVKLKPSVMVGQRSVMYPGWIEVRNEFTAQ